MINFLLIKDIFFLIKDINFLIKTADEMTIMNKETLLDIDQVTQLTGLSQATLRNWEKRFDFPQPQRSQGGHRLYNIEEVQKIKTVSLLCKEGHKVREAILKVSSERTPCQESAVAEENAYQTLNVAIRAVLDALYKFDKPNAQEALSRIGMRLSELNLLELVYPQLLFHVGNDWENGRINIAQEHFAWGFLRRNLLQFSSHVQPTKFQPKVILTTLSGELHEGALLILSAYLSLKGWNTYYLGVNLPIEDLAQAAEVINPDLICLSGIFAKSIIDNLGALQDFNRKVVVGGPCAEEVRSALGSESRGIDLVSGSLAASYEQLEILYFTVKNSKE